MVLYKLLPVTGDTGRIVSGSIHFWSHSLLSSKSYLDNLGWQGTLRGSLKGSPVIVTFSLDTCFGCHDSLLGLPPYGRASLLSCPFTGHHKSNNVDVLGCHKVAACPLDSPSWNPTLTFKMKAGLYSSVFRLPNKILEDQFSVHIIQTTTYIVTKNSYCLSEIKTDNLSFKFKFKKQIYFLNLAILLKIDIILATRQTF